MNYKKPNFNWEWKEATRYPFFKNMGKKEWMEYAKNNFQIISYKSIKKELGNVDLDYDNLNEEKKKRFEEAFAKGEIEIPIAVQMEDHYYDLVAGNTRVAGLIKNGINPKLWVIDVREIYENGNDMENIEECWDGYKEIGGKMKNGKMVPNCVPVDEASSSAQQAAIAINMKKKGIKPKNESTQEIDEGENKPTKPELWSRAKSMAKSKFDVYPSAYANGWASKWYKEHGGGWRKKSTNESEEEMTEDLRRWFKEKWVDVSKKVDGKHPPCGRKDADGKAYPKCRPSKKVSKETPKISSSYDKDEKKAMTQQKRRAEKKDPKVGKGNKPTMTHFNETDSGSSGAFDGPAFGSNVLKRPSGGMANVKSYNKSKEVHETVDASASGSFDVPLFGTSPKGRKNPLSIGGTDTIYKGRAVKDKDFPKWGGPGGVFVKIKDKCKKFPYCNQGDINAIEILHEAIQEVAKNRGFSTDQIEKLVLNEIKKIFI